MSACAFANPLSLLWGIANAAGAVDTPPPPISVGAPIAGCSVPFALADVVEGANGDGCGKAALGAALFWSALLCAEGLLWSTFSAVVDSEIAPVLNLGFGFAWIPV